MSPAFRQPWHLLAMSPQFGLSLSYAPNMLPLLISLYTPVLILPSLMIGTFASV